MKTILIPLSALLFSLNSVLAWENGASRLLFTPAPPALPRIEPAAQTHSSFDRPDPKRDREKIGANQLRLQDCEVQQVLDLYQTLSGRTVIRAHALPAAKITLHNETALSIREALQALDTALAENQITMVLMGTQFVKAVPETQALREAPPVIDLPAGQLPESKSYMTCTVRPKFRNVKDLIAPLQPFAGLPNSLVAIQDPGLLILSDYSANVRRMLEVLQKVDVRSANEGGTPTAPPPRRRGR